MIWIDQQHSLLQKEQLLPKLSRLSQLDVPQQEHVSYFYALPNVKNQPSLFVKVQIQRDRTSYHLYQFDNNQIAAIPNAISSNMIVRAQLVNNNKSIAITKRYTQTSRTLMRKIKTVEVTETSIHMVKYSNRQQQIKTDHFHFVHFLNDHAYVIFEKQHVHIQFISSFSKQSIAAQAVDVQGYDSFFCVISPLKAQQQLFMIELFQFDGRAALQATLATRALEQSPFVHQFSARFSPVSVIFQENRALVVNYKRREILLINLPNDDVDFSQQATNENQKFKYLYQQHLTWGVLFLDGLTVLYREDVEYGLLFTITIYTNALLTTKIAWSNCSPSQTVECLEVADFVEAAKFIAYEQQLATVDDAIRACREYVSAFHLRGKKQIYTPFVRPSHSVFNYYPQQIREMFQHDKQSSENSPAYVSDGVEQDLDELQLILQRFGPRVGVFQELQPADESTCISKFQTNEDTVLDASQSLIKFRRFELTMQTSSRIHKTTTTSSTKTDPENQRIRDPGLEIQDFLQPVVFDDKYQSFKNKFDAAIKNIPCPAHLQSDLSSIPRFTQLFAHQDSSPMQLRLYDFYTQTVSECRFDNGIQPEGFCNVLIHSEKTTQSQREDILFTSLKRQIFFESLFRCGFLCQMADLFSSNQQYFIDQIQKLVAYPRTDTVLLAQLLLSKVMVNVYASFIKPGQHLKHYLYLVAQQLQKLATSRPTLCQFVEEQPSATQSVTRFDEERSGTPAQRDNRFLPWSDGVLYVASSMQLDIEVSQIDKLQEMAGKVPHRVQLPRYCIRQTGAGGERLVGTVLNQSYQSCRYCFDGCHLRSLYGESQNKQPLSCIHVALETLSADLQKLELPIPLNPVLVAGVAATSATQCLDFVADQLRDDLQRLCLLEVVENLQVAAGEGVARLAKTLVGNEGDEIMAQLKSFGVIL